LKSIKELYKVGNGPSSSHTIGPKKAAEFFKNKYPNAKSYRAKLYGSLAATGKGHLTDWVIKNEIAPKEIEIIWHYNEELPLHPNGIEFEALDDSNNCLGKWRVYSIGGGALKDEAGTFEETQNVYDLKSMNQILNWTESNGKTICDYVEEREGAEIWDYLGGIWNVMKDSIQRGLDKEGSLPGVLKLARKASSYYSKAQNSSEFMQKINLTFAYALAVAEENASGGVVVTAPTCGSCGVVPGVLYLLKKTYNFSDSKILRALATAGIVGNLAKHNASISGAEVGCQGEIGVACAMAAAASTKLWGGTPAQIEYAAEMGLEHHLGLTCDPIAGLVQIPCIERNAMAASRAFECAVFALNSDGKHRISLDEVIDTMGQTGRDLQAGYRETSRAGLAKKWDILCQKFNSVCFTTNQA